MCSLYVIFAHTNPPLLQLNVMEIIKPLKVEANLVTVIYGNITGFKRTVTLYTYNSIIVSVVPKKILPHCRKSSQLGIHGSYFNPTVKTNINNYVVLNDGHHAII